MELQNSQVLKALPSEWSAQPAEHKDIGLDADIISAVRSCEKSKLGVRRGLGAGRGECRYAELLCLFESNASDRRFQPNSTILLHGDPATAIYRVESGTVRCCTIDDAGNRQIFRFAKKGEFIGIADIDIWHFTAEAVDHVFLKALSREIVERQLEKDGKLIAEFRMHMSELLEYRERQLLSLVCQKGPERLFHFLCEFASSRPGAGHSPVALPMCRRDIADHLGLSVETVSRAFTQLKTANRIEMVTPEKYQVLHGLDAQEVTAL